jgi:hypothetical protein
MALKAKVNSLEGLPEGVAEFYKQAEDGAYDLNVEGMVHKSKLDEFRANNIKANKELEQKTELLSKIDLDEYAKLKDQSQKMKDQDLIDAGKVDELVQQRTERAISEAQHRIDASAQAMEEATQRASKAEKERDSFLVETKIKDEGIAYGVRPEALPDLMARANRDFRLDPDTKTLVAMQGDQPLYNAKSQPLQVNEWLQMTETSAPHLFKNSSGGGASGGTGQATRRVNLNDQTSINSHQLEELASGKLTYYRD